MDREQQFFLNCISAFIKRQPVVRPNDPIDMEQVFQLASAHSMAGIVYSCCRQWMSAFSSGNAGKDFLYAFSQEVFFSVNRAAFLKEIASRFSEADIPFLCMKGTVIRDCYPNPELRSMGDIDIIIRTEDRVQADRIMCDQLGYRKFVDNHAVWTYNLVDSPYSFEVEVHDHMFYENLANRVDYRSYFNHIWEHCHNAPVFGIASDNLFVPDEDFHFLYLMTHTAKHIINNGSGFRAYLDMVLMAKNCDLNWKWISAELEKLELLEFTRTSFALCERWFDVKMPLDEKHLDEAFYLEVTQKTFTDGVFGLDNIQNAGAHAAKEIKRGQGSYLGGALRLTLHKAFPPYRDMQLIPWYKWVDGKPWLMPAAWVYRWFYCIKNKRNDSMDLLAEPFAKREAVEQREALIRSWGL